MRRILALIARLLWPHACAACGGGCDATGLCGPCAREIDAAGSGPRCLACGAVLGPYAAERAGCDACRGRALELARVVSVGPHEGALRRAVTNCG